MTMPGDREYDYPLDYEGEDHCDQCGAEASVLIRCGLQYLCDECASLSPTADARRRQA